MSLSQGQSIDTGGEDEDPLHPGAPFYSSKENLSDLCSGNLERYTRSPFPPQNPTLLRESDSESFTFIPPSSFHDPFFSMLRDLLENDDLCDVKIRVGRRTFSAHRVILASNSAYFRAMFVGSCRESKEELVTIHDIEETAFERVLDFIYRKETHLNKTNVQGVLLAACILQVDELREVCCWFIGSNLEVSNCLEIFGLVETLGGCEDLLTLTKEFLFSNFQSITERNEFLQLTSDQLRDIISSDDLNVPNEEIVYRALMRWVYHDVNTRRDCLPYLFEHIRLPLTNPKFLVMTVSDDNLVRSHRACRDILDEAKNYHLIKDIRHTLEGPRTRPRKSNIPDEVLIVIGGWVNGRPLGTMERLNYEQSIPHNLHHKFFSLRGYQDPQTSLETDWGKFSTSTSFYHSRTSTGPMEKNGTGIGEQFASMNSPRCGVGAVFYSDNLYAVGGHDGFNYLDTVERYDIVKNSWQVLPSKMNARRTSGGVVVSHDSIYAIGGQDGKRCLSIVERYDGPRDTWYRLKDLTVPRIGLGVATLDDGRIFAIGGYNAGVPVSTVEFYDPREGRWLNSKEMSELRKHLGVVENKGLIYAVGGRSFHQEESSAEVYDPRADVWRQLSPMNTSRSGVSLSVYKGNILAIGGYDGKQYLRSYEQYDPVANKWIDRGLMNEKRLGCGSTTIKLPTPHFNFIYNG